MLPATSLHAPSSAADISAAFLLLDLITLLSISLLAVEVVLLLHTTDSFSVSFLDLVSGLDREDFRRVAVVWVCRRCTTSSEPLGLPLACA